MSSETLVKHDWPAAFALYLGFMKLDQISEVTGIPEDLLLARAKKYNWYKNRALAQANAERGIKQSLQKRIEEHKNKHQHFILDQLNETQEVIEGIENTEEKLFTKLNALNQHDTIARKTLKLDEEQKQDPNTIGFHLLVSMSKNLVNDKKTVEIEAESEIIESPETEALRRYVSNDDKNDSKPILRALNGIPLDQKTQESGHKPIFEFQAKPKELKFIEPGEQK